MVLGYLTYAFGQPFWGSPSNTRNYFNSTGAWAKIEFPVILPTNQEEFNALSWNDIATLSSMYIDEQPIYQGQSNWASPIWDSLLGYYKEDTLDGVGTIKCKLIGVSHDLDADGNPVGLTFQICEGISSTVPASFKMNSAANTTGGWRDSYMRNTNVPLFKAALSSELQAVMKTVSKKSCATTSSGEIVTTEDELFPLSMVELYGNKQDVITDNPVLESNFLGNEGQQYIYFKRNGKTLNDARSIHVIKNNSGSASAACTRSPHLTNARNYYQIGSNGSWSAGMATSSTLPAFGFCV